MRQDFADINQSHFVNNIDNLIKEIKDIQIKFKNGIKTTLREFLPNFRLYHDLSLLHKTISILIRTQNNIKNKNTVLAHHFKTYYKPFHEEAIEFIINDYCNNRRKSYYKEFLDSAEKEELKSMLENYIQGGIIPQLIASIIIGIDAAELLKLSGKNANLNNLYTLKAIKYNTPDELPDKYKNIIKEKLKSQKLNLNSQGLLFFHTSGLAKRITKSKDFQSLIRKNINNIPTFREKQTFYGTISGDLIDTTDYNADDPLKLVQAARDLQLEGKIEPKFIIVHFEIPNFFIIMKKRENNDVDKY